MFGSHFMINVVLKNEWSPALTIRTTLLSLQALLSCPEPDDPQDAEVAKEYKTNRNKFNDTALQWTNRYANGKQDYQTEEQIAAVQSLVEMGFKQEAARSALQQHAWDKVQAVEYLFESADN
jgi:ubiquitin-conjugating enzyme (huntingtin interacting protein 2)